MLEKFKNIIAQKHLFNKEDRLLIAVSGGIDSVVLCELCHQSGFDFKIAHCNFQLRSDESKRDEQFVVGLGEKYSVNVFVKIFDTAKHSTDNKLSIQEAARNLRYSWFQELINQPNAEGFNYLLTAHHADDNNETLLMNFFRGTGLHGITGIPEKTGYILRPLLTFSKKQLAGFAKENSLAYVEDSSNQSIKYTRNYFRNELLPAIAKVYPQVNENLASNIERFKQIESLYKFSVEKIMRGLCRNKGNEVHIPVKQLAQYDNKALIYEIIHPFQFSEKQVEEVVKLLQSESGKYVISAAGNYRIIRHRHWLIISPTNTDESVTIVIEEVDKETLFALGKLKIERSKDARPSHTPDVATLDFKQISFPLLLRKWKTGDYFYPLGMRKKKKVARFLIDQKLSKTQKENTWVIESQQRIVWIVGQRIDDRMKIAANTKQILRIQLHT
jgi:tRNA(Ile)-lysidine synthase